jgi:hypothetical protein
MLSVPQSFKSAACHGMPEWPTQKQRHHRISLIVLVSLLCSVFSVFNHSTPTRRLNFKDFIVCAITFIIRTVLNFYASSIHLNKPIILYAQVNSHLESYLNTVTDRVIFYTQVKQCIRVCRNGRPITPIKWEVLRPSALLAVCKFVERRAAVILRFICPPSFTTWCHWLKIKQKVEFIST